MMVRSGVRLMGVEASMLRSFLQHSCISVYSLAWVWGVR